MPKPEGFIFVAYSADYGAIETDFSHANALEVMLALICLGGAYLTGIGLILVSTGLARLEAPLYGLRKLLVYAFFVCGLFMTGYSVVVTLQSLKATGLLFALSVITFYLTDLSFIIVCVLLTLLFFRASYRGSTHPTQTA